MNQSVSTVSYFPMKHDEWKLMSICQPSFARTKEKGHFKFDFLILIKISCQQNDCVTVCLKPSAVLLCVVVSVATMKPKSLPEAY